MAICFQNVCNNENGRVEKVIAIEKLCGNDKPEYEGVQGFQLTLLFVSFASVSFLIANAAAMYKNSS